VLSDLQANASVLEHQAHRQLLARRSQHDIPRHMDERT
jgi:hypothetical protein